MSVIVNLKTKITNIDSLGKAVNSLGGELVEEDHFIHFYGIRSGCKYAIKHENARYSIGLMEEKDVEGNISYSLLYDDYNVGGIERVFGKNLHILLSEYAKEIVRDYVIEKGFILEEVEEPESFKMILYQV